LGAQRRGKPGEAELGVLAARRQRDEDDRLAVPRALELGARQKKHLAVAVERVGDRDLLRPAAPRAEEDDGVAVVQDEQQRMGKGARLQPLPIEPRALAGKTKIAGD